MSTPIDLGPFGDITHVIRMPDGSLLAYDAGNTLIVELDDDGLVQLQDVLDIQVSNALPRESAKAAGFGQHYGTGTKPLVNPDWLAPVKVKTTGPVYLNPGTAPTIVDGVQLHKGDRILIADHPDPRKNGIHHVWRTDQSGSRSGMTPGHSWLVTDDNALVKDGATVCVTEGVLNANTVWVYDGSNWCSLKGPGVVADPADQAFLDLFKPDPKPVVAATPKQMAATPPLPAQPTVLDQHDPTQAPKSEVDDAIDDFLANLLL